MLLLSCRFLLCMFAATLIKWGHGRHNESSNDRNFEAGNNGLNHKACRIAESKPQVLQIVEKIKQSMPTWHCMHFISLRKKGIYYEL